jgi:hypothetical protein
MGVVTTQTTGAPTALGETWEGSEKGKWRKEFKGDLNSSSHFSTYQLHFKQNNGALRRQSLFKKYSLVNVPVLQLLNSIKKLLFSLSVLNSLSWQLQMLFLCSEHGWVWTVCYMGKYQSIFMHVLNTGKEDMFK